MALSSTTNRLLLALGSAVVLGAGVYAAKKGWGPPPPPDANPRTGAALDELTHIEWLIAQVKRRGATYPGELRSLRSEYSETYREVFGEEPGDVP